MAEMTNSGKKGNGSKSYTDSMSTPAGQKSAFDRGGNPMKMSGLKESRNTGKSDKATGFIRRSGTQNS